MYCYTVVFGMWSVIIATSEPREYIHFFYLHYSLGQFLIWDVVHRCVWQEVGSIRTKTSQEPFLPSLMKLGTPTDTATTVVPHTPTSSQNTMLHEHMSQCVTVTHLTHYFTVHIIHVFIFVWLLLRDWKMNARILKSFIHFIFKKEILTNFSKQQKSLVQNKWSPDYNQQIIWLNLGR